MPSHAACAVVAGSRRVALLRCILVVTLALGSCTRTDDEGATGAQDDASLTHAEFITAHEEAAERYADALADVQAEGMAAVQADPIGAHEVYDQLRNVTEAAALDFASLSPPNGVADLHTALVALLDEQVQTLRQVVSASQARDDRALETHMAEYARLLAAWREQLGQLTAQADST